MAKMQPFWWFLPTPWYPEVLTLEFYEAWNLGPPGIIPLQHGEEWTLKDQPTFVLQHSEAWSS